MHSSSLPERNPATEREHRRQVLWQITLPFVFGVVVFLVLAVLTGLSGVGEVSRWADVSTIWLIIPVLFVGLIFLAILGGLIFAVIWLVRNLPRYALKLQNIFALIEAKTRQASDAAVEPILRAQSFSASVKALRRNLRLK